MSWQAYVDEQIAAQVPCKLAVIASNQGAIWSKYENGVESSVTEEELAAIAKNLKTPNAFQQSGIKLAGEKYFCISAEPDLVRGRKNKNALCIVGTVTAMIIAVGDEVAAAGVLNNTVEKLADYLKQNGY